MRASGPVTGRGCRGLPDFPSGPPGPGRCHALAECWRPGLMPFALTQAHCGHGG